MALGIGIPLHPDLEYLELVREIAEREADYFEINPEALWRPRTDGRLEPNDFHALFRDIRARAGKPFVAHGLAFSVGTPLDASGERERASQWLERLRDDHAAFSFVWLTEHLGWTSIEGLQAELPLPLPCDDEALRAVGARLRMLRGIVPQVGLENPANAFAISDPDGEPEFLNTLCREVPCGLLLDLHNLHVQAINLGIDPERYLGRLNLEAVLQIHLSGGSESEPGWVPSGRVFRIDGHDGPVPEAVWRLLERARPRCSNLQGIVVERMNGTLSAAELPSYRDELRRAREVLRC